MAILQENDILFAHKALNIVSGLTEARRMAEGNMSGDIIKAVTGHSDLKQVSVYTAAANQAALAEKGAKAIAGKKKKTASVQPSKKVGQTKGV